MERAPLLVRRRLFRATRALTALNIPHAVVGECATALWVASVDKTAMRNSRDVDIMIERADFPRVQAALAGAGFVFRHLAGIDMFLESPDAKARNAVHIHFTGERIRPDADPNPPLATPTSLDGVPVLSIASLVTMKLSAWRPVDQMQLTDLLEVGLIGAQDFDSLPEKLRERARTLEAGEGL